MRLLMHYAVVLKDHARLWVQSSVWILEVHASFSFFPLLNWSSTQPNQEVYVSELQRSKCVFANGIRGFEEALT